MADSNLKTRDTGNPGQAPVLRPGRPADPEATGQLATAHTGPEREPENPPVEVPPEGRPAQSQTGSDETGPGRPDGGGRAQAGVDAADPASESEESESEEMERRYAESYQRRLRRLLRQCERVNLLDFNILSLSGWPDSYTLSAARRRRDSWLLSATVAALVFLSGLTGMVPAWIAGGGFGAFVVILLLGVPFVRRLYTSSPSYLDLIFQRQQLLRDARRHV
ncbi:MAG: hypothetical protein ACQET2_05240, partial [Pseudomonadota bacterium]